MAVNKKGNDIEIYPFVDELVETLCTSETKKLIYKHIENDYDKKTFMMFVFIYFSIEFKILDMPQIDISDEKHKEGLKCIISEIIRNPEKRKMCIQMFKEKFNNKSNLFLE